MKKQKPQLMWALVDTDYGHLVACTLSETRESVRLARQTYSQCGHAKIVRVEVRILDRKA